MPNQSANEQGEWWHVNEVVQSLTPVELGPGDYMAVAKSEVFLGAVSKDTDEDESEFLVR